MKKYILFYKAIIFILILLNIQSFQFLKAIYLNNNKYYMITTTNIYSYTDGTTVNKKSLFTFQDEQIISTYHESEMIKLSLYDDGTSADILLIKHYVYSIMSGSYYCDVVVNELKGYYSEIFALKCVLVCYFIVGNINSENKKLQLYLTKSPAIGCNSEALFETEINSVDSSNINCQLMQSPSSSDKVLTCFYQSSSEIIASSFNINTNQNKLELISSLTKSKTNDGAIIIKSKLSQNNKKAIVCCINNDQKCYCLTYDIMNNEWSDYYPYLSNCLLEKSSLNIDYSDNSKEEYVVYCFQYTTKLNIQ